MTREGKLAVVAVFHLRAGQEDFFMEAAESVVAPTLAEEGCIEYELHRHRENASVFMFWEKWSSQADLDRHLESAHIKSFLGRVQGALESDIQSSYWDPVTLGRQ
jgi:quinol monooxygenase YgiN